MVKITTQDSPPSISTPIEKQTSATKIISSTSSGFQALVTQNDGRSFIAGVSSLSALIARLS